MSGDATKSPERSFRYRDNSECSTSIKETADERMRCVSVFDRAFGDLSAPGTTVRPDAGQFMQDPSHRYRSYIPLLAWSLTNFHSTKPTIKTLYPPK